MKRILIFLIFFFVVSVSCLQAQDDDFGVWLDAEAALKQGPFKIALLSEYYTKNNNQSVDRFSVGVDGQRKLDRVFSIGAGYLLMNKNAQDGYEIRHRVYTNAFANWRFSNLKFSVRERLQLTRYPGSDLESSNARIYWRNRAKVSYLIPSCKIIPTIGVETFLLMNRSPEEKRLDEVRYSLATAYPVTGKSQIELYGLLADMPRLNQYILGIAYLIEL
ncbi:MAG: DUF2490 domain-containing protein [Mangrovibacterium sp.]|nr:DUF2490 domain-containing protein [Mangrovibacterium sp.]